MAHDLDLMVIGTGSAGETVAFTCANAGLQVAIADCRPFGGTCALRGCDPKKVLVGAAEVIERFRGLQGNGLEGNPRIDWPELMALKQALISTTPESIEQAFLEAGIEAFHGVARFTGPQSVAVGDVELTSRTIVIATGGKPRSLNVPGEKYMTTSDGFLSTATLPHRIIFIGGGYIACELSHVAAKAGSAVTLLTRGDRLLRGFDPDLVDIFVDHARTEGIDILTDMPLQSIEKEGDEFKVEAGRGSGSVFGAEMVVHGAGRVPDLDNLDLEAGEVAVERGAVVTNEYLQSVSNPSVFIAGDANAGGIALTPVASMEGRVVARNILEGNNSRPDYSIVPSVVYTIPPIASVGLSEESARRMGGRFVIHSEDTRSWYSSRRIGSPISGYKIILDEKDGRILGAHLLGHNADEVINIFALAMKMECTADELRHMLWAYPTGTSDIRYML